MKWEVFSHYRTWFFSLCYGTRENFTFMKQIWRMGKLFLIISNYSNKVLVECTVNEMKLMLKSNLNRWNTKATLPFSHNASTSLGKNGTFFFIMWRCRAWIESTLCSVSSIQSWFQNNLHRQSYSKGKCLKPTPTYSGAKWPKGSNTHTLKILLSANYVYDEALQDSEVPFWSL